MALSFLTLNDVHISNKRVLIREDFNVPIKNGIIESDLRIRAALPGIEYALSKNAQVILMSHLGRPEAGHSNPEYSLEPIGQSLQELLKRPVKFVKDWFLEQSTDSLILMENVRFLPGETENDPVLAKKMADLCDVFVMDAFGSAHRAHASTMGVINFAKQAVAGPLLSAEITALDKIMLNPARPLLAIIGGAKVSSKFEVLASLVTQVNVLIIGGGMANTMLAAQGYNVGASLYEPDLIPMAQKILSLAQMHNCQILLPTDVVIADGAQRNIKDVQNADKILDIGKNTITEYIKAVNHAATILWNGPLGVFEDPQFAVGTQQVALAIANSKSFAVAGGGDTLAAIDQFAIAKQISYISTGGGAFLEYIEGKKLPTIMALINKSANYVTSN